MISILIPIYNTPIEFINECFDSIDRQTFKEYEVIIVNDGSNDETTEYLNNIKRDKYSIYHKKNGGISSALNYGLEKCKYDIIARMDADDIMYDDRLEKQYNYYINNNINVLGAQMELFGFEQGITNHINIIPNNIVLNSDWFMNHPTIMYNKKEVLMIGGYNSEYDGLEDLELWYRFLDLNIYKLYNMNDILVKHRRHSDNATVRNNMGIILNKINNVRRYYANKLNNKN